MKPLLCLLLLTVSFSSAADSSTVLALFEKHCSSCHYDADDQPPVLDASINLSALQASAEDVKSLLDRISRKDEEKGRMPKSKGKPGDPGYTAPLSAEEIALLQSWAKGELKPAAVVVAVADKQEAAPAVARGFISLRDELKTISTDLARLDASLQPTTRYLTLTNLHNQKDAKGEPALNADQLDEARAAISKLLNSLSSTGKITMPSAVDAEQTVYRFDLRDYGFTAAEWEGLVVKAYPYGVRGVDARAEADITKYTHSAAAWLRADWFVFAASQPPLYHDLLKIPHTEPELEQQQGVDTLANLRAGRAIRAGFRESGVSQGNRLIERHEAKYGMYWKSYDFTPLVRTGQHDLFRSPLGPVGAGLTKNADREFLHDGGEVIWTLPNGLHGYLLATSDGQRIDRGPTEIVQDKRRRDGAIINGISCMKCHDQGMKYTLDKAKLEEMKDEVGPVALKAGLDREETHAVTDLYATVEKLQAAVAKDEAAYKAAAALAMPGYKGVGDPVSKVYSRFTSEIKLEALAAEFGEEDASFLKRLKDSRDADLESIAAQFESGLGFPRASWLDQFQRISEALSFSLQAYTPVAYTEFTSSAKAGGNEGRAVLAEGGKLTLSTDKAHYHKGELLSVKLKSTEGVYVRLYHLSAEKKLTQIFPNVGRGDNFIKGGESVTLPGEGDAFRFRMGAPFGTEIILAVASPVQFTDAENLQFAQGEVFKTFAETDLRAATQRGVKGLTVETTDVQGKVTGIRSAPNFTARAVFTVSE